MSALQQFSAMALDAGINRAFAGFLSDMVREKLSMGIDCIADGKADAAAGHVAEAMDFMGEVLPMEDQDGEFIFSKCQQVALADGGE